MRPKTKLPPELETAFMAAANRASTFRMIRLLAQMYADAARRIASAHDAPAAAAIVAEVRGWLKP